MLAALYVSSSPRDTRPLRGQFLVALLFESAPFPGKVARFPLLLHRDPHPCARATLIIRLVYRLDAYNGVKFALELCSHACADRR